MNRLLLKIRYVLLFSILLFLRCEKKDCDIIPNVTVDFTINLNTPPFNQLQAFGNAVEVPINHAPYSKGYDDSGIIIYRDSDNEFLAFDRTCTFPHDETISVEVVEDEQLFARCPECESEFLLASYGAPIDGSQATCPLKEYDATFYSNRNEVRVINYR